MREGLNIGNYLRNQQIHQVPDWTVKVIGVILQGNHRRYIFTAFSSQVRPDLDALNVEKTKHSVNRTSDSGETHREDDHHPIGLENHQQTVL